MDEEQLDGWWLCKTSTVDEKVETPLFSRTTSAPLHLRLSWEEAPTQVLPSFQFDHKIKEGQIFNCSFLLLLFYFFNCMAEPYCWRKVLQQSPRWGRSHATCSAVHEGSNRHLFSSLHECSQVCFICQRPSVIEVGSGFCLIFTFHLSGTCLVSVTQKPPPAKNHQVASLDPLQIKCCQNKTLTITGFDTALKFGFTFWYTLLASVMASFPQFIVTFLQHESGTVLPSGLKCLQSEELFTPQHFH